MLDRRARRAPLLVVSLVSVFVVAACGGEADKAKPAGAQPTGAKAKPDGASKTPTDAPKPTPTDPPKEDPTQAEGGAEGAEPAAEGGEPAAEGGEPAAEGGEPAAEGGEPAAEGGEPAAEGGDPAAEGGEPAAEGGEAQGEGGEAKAEGGGKDSAALIKEARTTKTTDERALEALAEAEAAGATVKELARAAKARGDYLFKDPERAKVFYEWSAEKDENYADPVFALAKQKAVTGDVEDVVKLLKKVSDRKGGKKLLEQIDFDPTWDIVKDDPDVRALL